jgi:hypothetical protein
VAEEDLSGRINKAKPREKCWAPSPSKIKTFFYGCNAGTLAKTGHTTVKESKFLFVETPHQ